MAKINTPPKIADDQFILAGVTGIARGQKLKNQSGRQNKIEMMFNAMPKRPRDHLRGGKDSPLSPFSRTQPIVTMYDVRIETLPQESMAFKAVVDPRSMQARRELISSETNRAWSGIFQPGVTCIT
jgi:hypothetical protein